MCESALRPCHGAQKGFPAAQTTSGQLPAHCTPSTSHVYKGLLTVDRPSPFTESTRDKHHNPCAAKWPHVQSSQSTRTVLLHTGHVSASPKATAPVCSALLVRSRARRHSGARMHQGPRHINLPQVHRMYPLQNKNNNNNPKPCLVYCCPAQRS